MRKQTFLVLMCFICSFWSCKNSQKTVANNAPNSHNSSDWVGLYFGSTPCADCPAIDIQLQLNSDLTYRMSITYQDRGGTLFYSGKFTWNKAKSQIDLQGVNAEGAFEHYKVQKDRLLLLTPQGEVVSGENADFYILSKAENSLNNDITNTYWKLVELNGEHVNYSKGTANEGYMIFKPDGKVQGSLSCNTFMGVYTLDKSNSISFSNIISTRKMCKDMRVENEFSQVFQMVDSYTLTENQLILNNAGKVVARFEVVYLR